MRIAFLGHNQPIHASNPSGGWLSRREADNLLREMAAERISQKRIRAFAPGTVFPRRELTTELPPMETAGCVYRCPSSPSWLMQHAEVSRTIRVNARLKRLELGFDKPRKAVTA
jgi:hypothetical protein